MTVDSISSSVVKSEHLSAKGAKRMPDSEAKKRWIKENTTMIHIKLNHNTDQDLLEFFETLDNRAGFIKQLVRDYLKTRSESAQPTEEEVERIFEDEELEALYGDLPWDEEN